ncbi:MAG: hypothetical protein H6608_07285 [Flavobacteriales bacterium]|nr:hypothetical protein [Bacteroidota bacterium]MCB9240916.1 hypothetical protein [Flavobacteriales bacterium]
MSKNKNSLKNLLSAEAIQSFAAALSGLEPQEMRKAKELYLRNAITELKSEKRQYKASWITMGLHLLIPIFWPMLFGAQKQARIELEEYKERISNALEVWKDDLGSSYYPLQNLLESVSNEK